MIMGLSVKEIVDKYQGNKKDIAQAAQFALIDPTEIGRAHV